MTIRLANAFTNNIKIITAVLEQESQSGNIYTREEMVAEAMKMSMGKSNPKQIEEIVDKICDERGI